MSIRLNRIPIISLFHNPSCSHSLAALSLLRSASDRVLNTRAAFNLDVVEYIQNPPTPDQLRLVSQYLGPPPQKLLRPDAPKVESLAEVIAEVRRDPAVLERPIAVDWDNGRAVIGRPPEKVLELVPKEE